jgi:hypothetical protein
LAKAFLSIDERMIKPDVRKFIEENWLRVSNEKLSKEKVIYDAIQVFEDKMNLFYKERRTFLECLKESGLEMDGNLHEADIGYLDMEQYRVIPGEDYLLEESTAASTNFVDSDEEKESLSFTDLFNVENSGR